MAKKSDISSTKKLLDLIRSDKKDESAKDVGLSAAPPKRKPGKRKLFQLLPKKSPAKKQKPRIPKIVSSRAKITVGVDIGYNDIRLAKVAQSAKHESTLLDYWKVPFDPRHGRNTPQFIDVLEPVLKKFCGSKNKAQIWCSISSANAEVRHIHIPKVASDQVANAVFWTFKKETPIDEDKTIFDFEVQGDYQDGESTKLAVMAYTAPKQEVIATKNLFAKCNFPLTGISITPFAIQNMFRSNWIEAGSEITICNLYIGREWSRIDIFAHGNLSMIRGIKTGINSMIEEILDGVHRFQARQEETAFELNLTLENEEPAEPAEEPNQAENGPDRAGQTLASIDEKTAHKILFSLSPESPQLSELGLGFKLTEEDVFEMIHPVAERLIRQVERTFEHYSSIFGRETVSKIYVSGSLDSIKRLVDHIGSQLGIPGGIIDPFVPSLFFAKGIASPETTEEKISYGPAIGLALSDNARTPNFLFTHNDKQRLLKVNRLNKAIIGFFVCLTCLTVGYSFWQSTLVEDKKSKIIELQQELARYPQVEKETIREIAAKVTMKGKALEVYHQKYLGIAILSELVKLTPDNIFLLNCMARFGSDSGRRAAGQQKNTLVLEGLVAGNPQMLESSLTSYLIKLAESPIFSQPNVHNSSFETYEEEDVLYFTVYIEMI